MASRWARLAVGGLVMVLAAGCGGQKTSPKGKRIGVSLLTREHVFYRDLEEALVDEAKRLGYELVVTSADFDPNRQASQVEDFITRRVDAIVICPVNSASIGRSVEDANRAGIPVFTADVASQGGEVVCHVASDNEAGGRLAGEYLAKAIGYQGKVVIIDHPEATSVLDRVKGFEEAIAKYPGIRIVAKPDGGAVRERAMQVMEDMLQAHPDVKGVFGINDDTALGALAAIEAAGRVDIVLVGYDATPDALAAILRGSPLKADVVQHPKEIGRVTIQMIDKYFRGENVPKVVPIQVGILDRETLLQEQKSHQGSS
ncbi:MAG: substrate-binding domain-containing protein [candidate division KSB1 bacterium]|nr:substrate-binding domain-containing protein [candidate division KSB1 bacterium]